MAAEFLTKAWLSDGNVPPVMAPKVARVEHTSWEMAGGPDGGWGRANGRGNGLELVLESQTPKTDPTCQGQMSGTIVKYFSAKHILPCQEHLSEELRAKLEDCGPFGRPSGNALLGDL